MTVAAARAPDSRPRLLADIGGTNARFALAAPDGGPYGVTVLPSERFTGLAEAAEAYLADIGSGARPVRAAVAVASPITGDQVTLTNRQWSFSIEALRNRLGLERLSVVNDFTAIARAIPYLEAGDRVAVGGGAAAPDAPVAVLGPGTGLGVSGLVPDRAGGWLPLSTEGGHVTLPATDAREMAVIDWLRGRYEHVSAERALSGPGLVNLHEALARIAGRDAEALEPAEITARALLGNDPLCADAVALFCAFLGTVAGNLALSLGARGGVWIAGGIVPRIGDAFARSPFRARFEAKGRFTDYMKAIPTWVITHKYPAFPGLAALVDEIP
jgi:glucokinase